MMLKTGMEVEKYCTVFNYEPPRTQEEEKPKYMTILAGPGVNPEPTFVLPWNSKGKYE